MSRDYTLYLNDITDAIQKIQAFTKGMDFSAFVNDEKTNNAVVRKIEIIGEAAKQVPSSIMKQYPEVPWSDMARMRDKIIHGYFGVDFEIVWKVVKEKLPDIKNQIEEVLKGLQEKT